MTARFFNNLALRRNRCELQVEGVGNLTGTYTRGRASIRLSSIPDPSFELAIDFHIIDSITSPTPVAKIADTCWQHLRNLPLADPTFGTTGRIDALIGADIWGKIIDDGIVRGNTDEPFAQFTRLGWVVFGPAVIESPLSANVRLLAVRFNGHDQHVDDLLRTFFEMDEAGATPTTSTEADACEQIFMATHTRNPDGRYSVQIPFRSDAPVLGNSHQMALRQFYQLERRLKTNPDLKSNYVAFMREYISLGHMRAIPDQRGDPSQAFYIPHHPVTVKFRVVFNASAQTSNGISLNDTQLVGAILQPLLVNIIFRFRRFAVALSADVEKMFRQVCMDERHRQWQQILWRESCTEPLRTYQLATVTYGTASGPYLAVRAMQQCGMDNCDELVDVNRAASARQSILRDFYVDDYLTSTSSTQKAIELAKDVESTLKRGQFHLRKWRSNDHQALAQITGSPSVLEDIQLQPAETTVLGLHWDPVADELFYKIKLDNSPSTSKRQVLSDSARLYDPLGILAPVIIVAKIFIQKLWQAQLAWDTPLPDDLLTEWLSYRNGLRQLETIRIPRWLGIQPGGMPRLHGFCDASAKAYAAVIYLCALDKNGKRISTLITAKAKVAPVKTSTIPRLELCAAHLLATTMTKIREAMELVDVPFAMWTDSSIVLAWLRKPASQLKPYVANRVGCIQQHSKMANWNHIRSRFNPADCASRGITAESLTNHHLWWHGPPSLLDDEQLSPEFPTLNEDEIADMEAEMKPILANVARLPRQQTLRTYYKKGDDTIVIDLIDRFSSIGKLLRTTAYVFRLLPKNAGFRCSSVVSVEEMDLALQWHILAEQKRNFAAEISQLEKMNNVSPTSKIITLAPYIDTQSGNVLRVEGRLKNADISSDQRHPIILPKEGNLTRLIVHQAHQNTLHGGLQLLLQTLRRKYWILKARIVIKQCIHSCITCRRHQRSMSRQKMASLPRSRVLAAPPFSSTGIDYCGPFSIRTGSKNTRTMKKTYVAIFVCMATKAVHIELAEDLTAEAFINVFTRFINRRGPCHHLYSDNGTSFVGADRIMKQDLVEWHSAHAKQQLANKGTSWHFISPAAPHQGGLWEAAVKAAKKHLLRVVGTQSIYYDKLHTLLVHIEACLNSRPLVALHDDIDDHLALTPAELLIGRPIITIPDAPIPDNIPTNRLTYHRHLNQMKQHFWQRWHEEYLSTLQHRSKWHQASDNLQVNDVVIIRHENLPATHWRLGRIIALHPGDDGLVRVVTIKHAKGECTRPVQKVCKLMSVS